MTPPIEPVRVEIYPWEIRDPTRLVREVARRVALTDGTAHAVLVRDPAGAQEIAAVEELGSAYLAGEDDGRHDETVERLRALHQRWEQQHPGSRWGRCFEVVTFIVRRGLCVSGANESSWCQPGATPRTATATATWSSSPSTAGGT